MDGMGNARNSVFTCLHEESSHLSGLVSRTTASAVQDFLNHPLYENPVNEKIYFLPLNGFGGAYYSRLHIIIPIPIGSMGLFWGFQLVDVHSRLVGKTSNIHTSGPNLL